MSVWSKRTFLAPRRSAPRRSVLTKLHELQLVKVRLASFNFTSLKIVCSKLAEHKLAFCILLPNRFVLCKSAFPSSIFSDLDLARTASDKLISISSVGSLEKSSKIGIHLGYFSRYVFHCFTLLMSSRGAISSGGMLRSLSSMCASVRDKCEMCNTLDIE